MRKKLLLQFFAAIITFTIVPGMANRVLAQCTGVPNSGAAFAAPQVHTCSGNSNLSLGGATLGMGMLYQWEYSTDGMNWFPLGMPLPTPVTTTGTITQTTMYRVISTCTNSSMSNTSTVATVTVNPGVQVTPMATITPSTGTTACIDDDIIFTSTLTDGGSTPFYQWQVNGANVGTNSDTYVAPAGSLATNDNVSLTVTSSDPCAVPQTALASVTMTILPLTTPTVSASADQIAICETEIVTFNAVDNAPGGTYQWIRNGNPVIGATSATYAYAPGNGDVLSVEFTPPAAGCYENITVTSNTITISVTAGQPTLATISSAPNAVEGTFVTVFANLFNFSLNYSIDWYINTVYYTTTTVPYMSYQKGPGVDAVFAVANGGGGCYLSDTTNQIFISSVPTSVASVNGTGQISLYPNPSTNTLKVTGLEKGDQLQLLNIVGQPVLQKIVTNDNGEETLDVSAFPAGNYLLNVHGADGAFKEMIHLTKN